MMPYSHVPHMHRITLTRRGELEGLVSIWLFVLGAAANNFRVGFFSLVFLDFLDLSDSGILKIVGLNNAAISLVLPGRERKAVGCFL